MDWRNVLRALASGLEERVERVTPRQRPGKLVISPYRGFGRPGELIIRGRVLAEKAITRATEPEAVWRNLLNAYRRFESDEIPGVAVTASYRDAVVETTSDEEGHFQALLRPEVMDSGQLWHKVTLKQGNGAATAVGHVLVPPDHADFGVISDIDDTIVETGATSLRRMIRSVLLESAATRMAFEGVAALYQALHAGRNPIFYVSSGPWNLYDLLHDYMALNGIPHGPMFLQNYGIDEVTLLHAPHQVHKQREIQALLDYYPSLPFVLIGDSGQHDPEIYLELIRANRGRIRGAFIRDVTPESRDESVAAIAAQAAEAGTEMVYASTSADALAAAQRLGLTG